MRQRLVAEGARHVKERGIQGAGVDGIARRVGLSGAALYTHFESKQDFLCSVVQEELGESAQRFLASNTSLEEALARYLSIAHVRAPAVGCALPALATDVSRGDARVRLAFGKGLERIADALGELLDDPEQRFAVLAAAVGAVALARALPDDSTARSVLEATRELLVSATRGKTPTGPRRSRAKRQK